MDSAIAPAPAVAAVAKVPRVFDLTRNLWADEDGAKSDLSWAFLMIDDELDLVKTGASSSSITFVFVDPVGRLILRFVSNK